MDNKENPTDNNKENCANNNKENCTNNNKENPTDTTTKNCNCCKFIRNTILIIFSIITVAIIVIFSILLIRNNTHINTILIILTILLLSCIGIIFYYIKRHYDSIEKDSQLRAKLETDKLYKQLRIQKSNFDNTIEVIESLKSQLKDIDIITKSISSK